MKSVTPVTGSKLDAEIERARREQAMSRQQNRSAFEDLRALLQQVADDMRAADFPISETATRRGKP